uniref:Actin-related protein 7 n=1 Tax=Lygus hesperus TaxID=30085 RepID=A0A0A9XFH3_LYGHE
MNYDLEFYDNRTKCTINNRRSNFLHNTTASSINISPTTVHSTNNYGTMNNITLVVSQAIHSNQNVVVQCSPVRNPSYTLSTTAILRIEDRNTQGIRAVEDNIALPAITYSTIGSKVATVVPSNTVVGSPPGLVTVTLQPLPLEIPEGSVILIELPQGYSIENRVLSHTACLLNTKEPLRSGSDIEGYATYDANLLRIEFTTLNTIPETETGIYILCDGIQVPKTTTRGQDNLTILVMHDGI